MLNKHIPFVYRWEHKPTGKWYIGVRIAYGCHPNDGYVSSSKIIVECVKSNPTEWHREILATGTVEEMTQLEEDLLKLTDAANDPMSLNQTSGSTGKIIFKDPPNNITPKIKLKELLEQN